MGLFSKIAGGLAGFALGGPSGALIGSSLFGDDPGASAGEASAATLQASREALALNRERWAEAQGYLDPYIGRAEDAAQQFQAEMGLPQFGDIGEDLAPRDMSQIPGYQAVMDESLMAAEQSAVSSGSTAYGGRRLEAAGEVGANVQQSYYTNYMNMLQNLASPTVATNLSSMGMNQGIQMGQQNIAATNQSGQYMIQGAAARNAQQSDLMSGLVNLGTEGFEGGWI